MHEKLDAVANVPYPKMKTLMVIAKSAVLRIPNSAAICSVAGATIDDATGDIKVKEETTRVELHFFL